MSVSIKDVEKIADLAKLSFIDEEKSEILKNLNKILDYVDQLNELDTEGVEPSRYVYFQRPSKREDVMKKSLSQSDALKNAPAVTDGYIRVPMIIARTGKGRNR